MKAKFLIVAMTVLTLATGTVWAQKGHRERSMEQKEISTEQVARRMTDRMKENLSLTDEQVKQVYPICLEQAQAMREHRAERREMAEKSREAMAQQREQMVGKMKAVLTPEQYAQWIECRQCLDRKADCKGPACMQRKAKNGHHATPCKGGPCTGKPVKKVDEKSK